MDLSKAFDCLPHNLLLLKLEAYGLTKQSLNLIKSYIEEREQRVKVGGPYSEWTLTGLLFPFSRALFFFLYKGDT
jgi:hypothetical protein